MPNGEEFKAPTPELQQEFNLELDKRLAQTEKSYWGLTPKERLNPINNLEFLKMKTKQGLMQEFQPIASAEELRQQISAGEFKALPPALATNYSSWKQAEAKLSREQIAIEDNLQTLSKTMYDVGAPTAITKAAQFFYNKLGPLFGLEDPRASGAYERALTQYTANVERLKQISVDVGNAKTYQSLYEGLAAYIQSGKVSSYEDLFTLTNDAGEPITRFKEMGQDDKTLKQIFNEVSSALLGLPKGTSVKELDYADMVAKLAQVPKGVPPTTIHTLTVDAIIRSLGSRPLPEYPAGYPTIEDVLKGYNKAGVPKETVEELESLDAYVKGLEGYWEAISANRTAVLQGLEEAKLPEMGVGAILLQTISQPALTALDIFGKLYSEWIAPWGGFLYRLKSQGALDETSRFPSLPAEREFMKLYNEARLTDDWWHAGGKAFAETHLGFLERFLFEWVADPMSWFGGGLGKALTTGSKVGRFGHFIGPTVNIMESGWIKGWDVLIFDRIKNVGHLIAKTPFQRAVNYAGKDMTIVASYLVRKANGTYYSKIPMEKAVSWIKEARNWAIHHPEDTGDMALAGQAMLRRDALNESHVLELAKKFGSELDVTKDMVLFVNSITNGQITSRAGQILTRKTAPSLLLRTLGIHETGKTLRLARTEINKLFQAGIRNSDALLDDSTHVPDMLARLFNRNHGI